MNEAIAALAARDFTARVPAPVLALCRDLKASGYEAFLVGGAIRDMLLARPVSDFDIATSARPEEVTRVFGRRRTIPTGAAHGTVTVLFDRDRDKDKGDKASAGNPGVEVTTFRGEGAYSDGRRPESVVFLNDIVEDLRRRDFTVNAMAADPFAGAAADGSFALVDPFGGRADLDRRIIRAVGEASERFAEDGLRIMRAVRFAAQLGFDVAPETIAAIPGALPVLRKVSFERVRDEVLKLLGAPVPSVGLRLMQSTGILAVVLPELVDCVGVPQNRHHAYDVWEHTLRTVDSTPGDAICRLGALLHDVAKPRTAAPREDAPGEYTFFRHDHIGAEVADDIGRRLKLSNKDRQHVSSLVLHHMFYYTPEWSDGAVRRFLGRVGEELLPDLFALREGDVRGRGKDEDPEAELGELKRRISKEVSARSAVKVSDLAIDGGDVMRLLGGGRGPIVGVVLRKLLEIVLDDPAKNERVTLEALVSGIAAEAAEAPQPPTTGTEK